MRTFESGATRDDDTNKLDYEGFFHPEVMQAFAKYMHKHRMMADGSLRDSDNWQKGIPADQLMKSLFRHFMAVWLEHRAGYEPQMDDLCGIFFNTQALMLDSLKNDYDNIGGID